MLGTTSSQVTACSAATEVSAGAENVAIVTAEPPESIAGVSCVMWPDTQAKGRWIAVRSCRARPSVRT